MNTNDNLPEGSGVDEDAIIDDEPTNLTLTEIYNSVCANDEIIITIPIEEEQALRTGLAGVKAKQNAKLKSAGLTPDSHSLSYTVTPHKTNKEAINVHILLSKKATITVLSMKLPDDEAF